MKSAGYIDVLRDYLIPFGRRHYCRDWVLQHDNARPHVSNMTKNFLESKHVLTLPWPASSPDLNPIENLWSLVKRNVEKRLPKNMADLKKIMDEEWEAIPQDTIISLCRSVNSRLARCMELDGRTL